ncbi:uncharacterized protein LOC134443182 [Engraulis encrasicolus]|uniref:uncharacterized protein LOC134443182 n=1 Tax=Engraulis encrasicolus TaxID=184585 RepID=UPI002FD78EB5
MECGGIAVLQNEPRDLGQNQQSNQRTIQEVTEWLRARAESQSNVEKEEDGVQQNVVRIKEEEDDYGYPCSRSNGGWIPTEQSTSSSADINAELQQEEDEGEDEDEMLDMAPFLSSERSLFPSHPARGWLESLAAFPSFNTAAAGPEMAGDNGRLHKCPVCGRGFSRRSSMKRHVLGVHKRDSTGTSSHPPDSSSTEQTTSSLTANIKTEPMQVQSSFIYSSH